MPLPGLNSFCGQNKAAGLGNICRSSVNVKFRTAHLARFNLAEHRMGHNYHQVEGDGNGPKLALNSPEANMGCYSQSH